MNCARLREVLDSHLDREVDALTAAEVEIHLANCAECAGMRTARREMLERIRREAPRHSAPASLRELIGKQVQEAAAAGSEPAGGLRRDAPPTQWRSTPPGQRRYAPRAPSWLHAGALAAAAAIVGLLIGLRWDALPPDDTWREAVIVGHVASLASPQRLTEVAASDRHQIKPWFAGRIDFAPPVRDLETEGYALLGARLDQVADRPAAVIVYRVRNHFVSLFVWRAVTGAHAAPFEASRVRGFPVITWADGGLHFAAASDVDAKELERFVRLLQAQNYQ